MVRLVRLVGLVGLVGRGRLAGEAVAGEAGRLVGCKQIVIIVPAAFGFQRQARMPGGEHGRAVRGRGRHGELRLALPL